MSLQNVPPPPPPRSAVPVGVNQKPVARRVVPAPPASPGALGVTTVDGAAPKVKKSKMENSFDEIVTAKQRLDSNLLPEISDREVPVAAAAYVTLKKTEKKIAEDIAFLRAPLEKFLKEHKEKKVSASGTESVIVQHAGRKIKIQRQMRHITEAKADAILKIKRSKNLKQYLNKLVYTAEMLDMDELAKLIEKGKISEAEAKTLVHLKPNPAFIVDFVDKQK